MTYNSSEIARLLGVSVVALRNYEKSGLIEPIRNEQNNYRQYHAIDLNLIRRARSYMSYGFSLNEATDMLCKEDLSGVADAIQQQEESIERRMIHEYRLLQFTRQHSEYLKRISASEGECVIEMSPAFYGLPYREGVQIFDEEALHEEVKVWNDIRPFAETLLVYRRENFVHGKRQYQSGLCIEERLAAYFGITQNKYVRYYPARRSVHTVLTKDFEPDLDTEDHDDDPITNWIEERGLMLTADPIGRVLHTSKSSGKWRHHIEIWAPIA